MYGNDLLHRVLPIDYASDFKDQRGRVAPIYDDKKTYDENVREYKIYSMICCKLYLEDEIDDSLDPDALVDLVVLKAMYHPRFPSTFFNYIANSVDGIPVLQTENVGAYLEENYGEGLQKPDCEYLSLILELWSKRYPVLYSTNLKKAKAWIDKKYQLLPAWSAESTALLTDETAELVSDVQPTRRRAKRGLLPKDVTALTNSLKGVGILEDSTGKLTANVTPGAVVGVLDYLIKTKLVANNRSAAFRTLKETFGFAGSLRSIQSYKRSSEEAKEYYTKVLAYFESLE